MKLSDLVAFQYECKQLNLLSEDELALAPAKCGAQLFGISMPAVEEFGVSKFSKICAKYDIHWSRYPDTFLFF